MNTINSIAYSVYNQLCGLGFPEITAKIITSQAAHETGNFTSKVFIQNNNLFGFRRAAPWKTTSKGLTNTYSTYESISDSIKDFEIYFREFRYPKTFLTVDSYVDAIHQKGYFEASPDEYKRGVRHFYNLYFKND